MKKLIKRWKAESPDFWKKVSSISMGLSATGAAIIASPVVLPTAIVSIGGYLITAGAVGMALSKLTVKDGFKYDEN